MSPLTDIMATNGLVELCGAVEPGFPYDKANCVAERYASLLGVDMDEVCCFQCVVIAFFWWLV